MGTNFHSPVAAARLPRVGVLLATTALFAASSGIAAGQEADLEEQVVIDEIIVTATKRSENIQDIPLSITAIQAEALERSGVNSFDGFATAVPNLSFGYSGSGRQTARNFQIRGITGSGTSALYIGETPVPTSVDPRVIDLERVEVLRGPQGTLFGARSMGGLVRMIPAAPDTDETFVKSHVGFGTVAEGGTDLVADATVNFAAGERVAIRATGYWLRDAGFIDRLVDPDASLMIISGPMEASGDERRVKNINEGETYGGQLAVRIEAAPGLTLTPRIMHQKTDSDGPNFVDNDIENFTKVRQFDVSEVGSDKWTLGSFEAELDVGMGSIFSSTSYFKRTAADSEDSTSVFAGFLDGRVRTAVEDPSITSNIARERRFVQETRFASDFGGAFELIIGGFYQDLKSEGIFPPESIVPAGAPFATFGILDVGDSFFSLDQVTKQDEVGIFGEVDFKITPELTLTGGGRYYRVKTVSTRQDGGVLYTKLFGITPTAFEGEQVDKGFNPRAALTWEPSRNFTLYGNVAKGYRPGVANLGASVCAANGFDDVPDTVSSDSLWNYEIGAKSRLFNGRLGTSLSGFKIVWKDRRTTVVGDCGLGFGYADNVGEAQAEGFEFEFDLDAAEWLSLNGGVGYVDSRITDNGGLENVEVGTRLTDVPRWSGALAVDMSQDLGRYTPYSRIDIRYVGSSVSAQRNPRPDYELVNLRAGVRTERFDVSVFANNLFDQRANLSDPTELSIGLDLIAVNRPRTIGVDLRTRF